MPKPFVVAHERDVPDAAFAERQIHRLLVHDRDEPDREFFRTTTDRAIAAVNVVCDLVVERPAFVVASTPCMPTQFSLSAIGLRRGDILEFHVGPLVHVEIIDDRRVCLDGRNMNLAQASRAVLRHDRPVADHAALWLFRGWTLRALFQQRGPLHRIPIAEPANKPARIFRRPLPNKAIQST